MEGRRASGARFHPWGTDVRGHLVYDAGGHVALQIAKGARARFAAEDLEAGTAAEVQEAFDGYHAWYGRYTLAPDGSAVVHHVEASLFPNWEGADQLRWARFEGDFLVLASPPMEYGGEPVEFVTRWAREGPPSTVRH